MGLTPKVFYEMRLKDFFLKLHGFRLEQESKMQFQASLTRLQTIELINLNLKKEDKIKDPLKLWRFAWEDFQDENTEASEQEAEAKLKKLFRSL